jgi:hypothetical protein
MEFKLLITALDVKIKIKFRKINKFVYLIIIFLMGLFL